MRKYGTIYSEIEVHMQFKGSNLLKFIPNFTVIDMECTGRSNLPEDITEMSAIRYRRYEPVESYSVLVKPKNKILPFVENLTGITDAMLENEASVQEKIESFAAFLGDDIILGHNVTFDLGLVNKALVDGGHFDLNNDYIDTLRISRLLNNDADNHKLDTLCAYFNVERNVGHRGLYDCKQTAEVYIAMKRKYQTLTGGFIL